MKTAEEYITDEYGSGHLAMVIAEQDEVSVIGLMQEYGNYLSTEVAKKALNDARMNLDIDLFISDNGYESSKQSILSTPIQTP